MNGKRWRRRTGKERGWRRRGEGVEVERGRGGGGEEKGRRRRGGGEGEER